MALDETIPVDGDGETFGVLVCELAEAIRTLRTNLNDGELNYVGAVGNVGVGIATGTIKLDVLAKSGMSAIGGFCIKLTNESGNPSVAGDIVETSTTADAVDLADASALDPIGVFLESGVADGAEAWIVVGGIADVHMDAGGCAVHDRIITSATSGRGDVSNSPAVAEHFQEIGHAIEVAAANGTARCVLHFL